MIVLYAQFKDAKSTDDGGWIVRLETGEAQDVSVCALKTMKGTNLKITIEDDNDTQD